MSLYRSLSCVSIDLWSYTTYLFKRRVGKLLFDQNLLHQIHPEHPARLCEEHRASCTRRVRFACSGVSIIKYHTWNPPSIQPRSKHLQLRRQKKLKFFVKYLTNSQGVPRPIFRCLIHLPIK